MSEELTATRNHWNILQQPHHASSGVHAAYRTLLAAIDQGWRVEEPVQALPAAPADVWIYYFIITHPASAEKYRLFLPALPEVEEYVERNQFQVIEGSYY